MNSSIPETEINEIFERYILTSSVKLSAFCAFTLFDTRLKMDNSVVNVSSRGVTAATVIEVRISSSLCGYLLSEFRISC